MEHGDAKPLWLMAKDPNRDHRFASRALQNSESIRIATHPNDNGPSPGDERPLDGCYLGWLMGLEMAA
jgi:hypothetical protein